MSPGTGTEIIIAIGVTCSTRQAKNNREPVRASRRSAILYLAVMTRVSPAGAARLPLGTGPSFKPGHMKKRSEPNLKRYFRHQRLHNQLNRAETGDRGRARLLP